MKIKVKKLFPNSKLPEKATEGSFCYDVYSLERWEIPPQEKRILHTGLAFELPRGYALDIRPRSGLATQGLIILNSPGTLDSDYRGELLISVYNLCGPFIVIEKGDRIAQIRLIKETYIDEWEEVEKLSETERGKGGFGSTGR